MKHLDLFSGIGGFALAADRVFGEVEHTFCEIDPFCQEVLKKHWPKAKIYGDIRTLTPDTKHNGGIRTEETGTDSGTQPEGETRQELSFAESSGSSISRPTETGWDLLTGGFPCQPFSQAGRRQGTADDRYLWPEMLRVIREFHPRWVIGENVGGLVTWSEGLVLEQVHLDLESEGYEVQAFIIPAVAVNAPHRRDRVWIVGHAKTGSDRRHEREVIAETQSGSSDTLGDNRIETEADKHSDSKRLEREWKQSNSEEQNGLRSGEDTSWNENWLEVATRLCRVDDGIPRRLDRNPRLKALGNAIVPQVAEEIMRAIKLNP